MLPNVRGTLKDILQEIKTMGDTPQNKRTVVIDAGIASEENLKLIRKENKVKGKSNQMRHCSLKTREDNATKICNELESRISQNLCTNSTEHRPTVALVLSPT